MAQAISPIDKEGISQLIYYHPGVGTGNWLDQKLGGGFGVGLSANVRSAYSFLADNFRYGDEIFIFGFSRGAFTARSLSGLVSLVGLLEKPDMEYFQKIYDIYRSRKYRDALVRGTDEAAIRTAFRTLFPEGEANGKNKQLLDAINNSRPTNIFFLGVWDTVGSLGMPWPFSWLGGWKYKFHNTDLSENIVYAYHALAIDERRRPFKPTLWTRTKRPAAARKQILEQVWFVGCHSNIGGGYDDAGLSDTAFLWMASKAAAAAEEDGDRPLAFDEGYLAQKIEQARGRLIDSAAGKWRVLPKYIRRLFQDARPGYETCERIHASAVERYKWAGVEAFEPFPYRPSNANYWLEKNDPAIIAALSAFETRFRPLGKDAGQSL
jgi:uncharacterized protein (DUF2235 family)